MFFIIADKTLFFGFFTKIFFVIVNWSRFYVKLLFKIAFNVEFGLFLYKRKKGEKVEWFQGGGREVSRK